MSVLSISYLENHRDKYRILGEVTEICEIVIDHLLKMDNEKRKSNKEWKETSLGVLQVLNKVSLVLDSNTPTTMLGVLGRCVVSLKKIPEYGISPLIRMIEGNIYSRISGESVLDAE